MMVVVRLLRFLLAWLSTLVWSTLACVIAVVRSPYRAWTWTAPRWAHSSLWCVGIDIDVQGGEHLRGPAVFVSNHQSMLDVVVLPAVLPRETSFVAKKELARIPIWGWALASAAGIMIDRSNPRAAIRSIRRGLERLPKGWSIVVFPEGTRSKDGVLQPFKKGAFHIAVEAKLPVVPLAIEGARDLVPKHSWLPHSGTVYVNVGEPIDTSTWSLRTLDEHLALAEARVRRELESVRARIPRHREQVEPGPDASGAASAQG